MCNNFSGDFSVISFIKVGRAKDLLAPPCSDTYVIKPTFTLILHVEHTNTLRHTRYKRTLSDNAYTLLHLRDCYVSYPPPSNKILYDTLPSLIVDSDCV